MREGDGQHVQRERAARGLCGVSKNIEKNILVFVFWLNIACNVLICGEKNKHCLQVHLLARGNARAIFKHLLRNMLRMEERTSSSSCILFSSIHCSG